MHLILKKKSVSDDYEARYVVIRRPFYRISKCIYGHPFPTHVQYTVYICAVQKPTAESALHGEKRVKTGFSAALTC